MKLKIFILFLITFIISGCSNANYEITIDNENIAETVSVTFPKESTSTALIKSYSEVKTPISQLNNEKKYYKTKVTEDNNNYYLIYNYKHNFDSFVDSYFVTRCYEDFDFNNFKNELQISTSNQFLCLYMEDGAEIDSVNVRIKTKLNVLENNADSVKDGTYIWNITKDNYQNKPINITLEKEQDDSESKFIFLIVISSLALLFVLILLILKLRHNKINKF